MPLTFTACGGDDDDEPETSSLADNLPDESKSYVGLWINQGNKGYDWLFLPDGAAKAFPYDRGSSTFAPADVGCWTYDSDTNILATDIDSWQWQVTLANDSVWAGLSLGSGTVQTFDREESLLYYFLAFTCSTSWEEYADSTLILGTSSSEYISRGNYQSCISIQSSSTIYVGNSKYLSISEDDNDTDHTFAYTLRRESSSSFGSSNLGPVIGKGTVTLKNPISSTSAKLVFAGFIEKTLSITSF